MTIQQKAIEQLERVSRHLATIGEKEDYTEIAIQALEQECEDAVSRQAVLDIVKFEENWLSDTKSNNADTDIAFSGIRAQVAKLSPVTSAQKWIPCSERMPEKNGFYLCTTKDCIAILEFTDGNHHYHERPSFVSDVLGKCNSYVVAWMPLPEPYKAEMEREE